jgi:hypothetical protein
VKSFCHRSTFQYLRSNDIGTTDQLLAQLLRTRTAAGVKEEDIAVHLLNGCFGRYS